MTVNQAIVPVGFESEALTEAAVDEVRRDIAWILRPAITDALQMLKLFFGLTRLLVLLPGFLLVSGAASAQWHTLDGVSVYRLTGLPPRVDERYKAVVYLDTAWYKKANPDVAAAMTDPQAIANHWIRFGIKEGRQPSMQYDPRDYLNRYPDVKALFGPNNLAGATQHFLSFGERDGRDFRSNRYLKDVLAKLIATINGRSGSFFDVEWYINENADVKAEAAKRPDDLGRIWAAEHFQNWGFKDLRLPGPSPKFDMKCYINRYPEVKAATGADEQAAYAHFRDRGFKEGRIAGC